MWLEAYALEEGSVGDAGGREEDVVAADQIGRGNDAVEVVPGLEYGASFVVVAGHQLPNQLASQASEGTCREHAFGGAADSNEQVHAGAGRDGHNGAGDVAVEEKADPGPGAADLGDELVVPGAVTIPWRTDYEPVPNDVCEERAIEAIRKLLPQAEKQKVNLNIENIFFNGFLMTPDEMNAFVDTFDSERVNVHFDTGNIMMFQYPEHWIPILGARIQNVHLKEFSKKGTDYSLEAFRPLLDGTTNWPAVIDAFHMVRVAATLLHPIAPIGTEKVREQLGVDERLWSWEYIFEPLAFFFADPASHRFAPLAPKADFFEKPACPDWPK